MSTLVCELAAPAARETPARGDDAVRTQVRRLLAGTHPAWDIPERRRVQRYPYPRLVLLTPIRPDGDARRAAPVVVAGKHLSEWGLGFFHPDPLPYRLVIASLENGDHDWAGFVLDLTWCRFTRHGWYESGGRFLRAVVSPLKAAGSDSF